MATSSSSNKGRESCRTVEPLRCGKLATTPVQADVIVADDFVHHELCAQLFLATGGDDQEAGAGFDAGREGVVGRGVAGVEGDKKVERAGIHIMDMAGGEF